MRNLWTMFSCVILVCASCSSTDAGSADEQAGPRGNETRFDFESGTVGEFPADFASERTGDGPKGKWVIDPGDGAPLRGRVLAQVDTDASESRYLVCVASTGIANDARTSVHFQTRSGEVDQAAGIVVRYQDPRNYYLARANSLESNVRFYKIVDGVRKQLGSSQLSVSPKVWHKLLVEARGSTFRVEYDGTTLFTVEDDTFARAGKAGLWTKADSVTWFDGLAIESFDAAR